MDNCLYRAVSRKLPYRSIKVYVTIPKGIMEVVQNVVYCCLMKVRGVQHKRKGIRKQPNQNVHADWFKIMFL